MFQNMRTVPMFQNTKSAPHMMIAVQNYCISSLSIRLSVTQPHFLSDSSSLNPTFLLTLCLQASIQFWVTKSHHQFWLIKLHQTLCLCLKTFTSTSATNKLLLTVTWKSSLTNKILSCIPFFFWPLLKAHTSRLRHMYRCYDFTYASVLAWAATPRAFTLHRRFTGSPNGLGPGTQAT